MSLESVKSILEKLKAVPNKIFIKKKAPRSRWLITEADRKAFEDEKRQKAIDAFEYSRKTLKGK